MRSRGNCRRTWLFAWATWATLTYPLFINGLAVKTAWATTWATPGPPLGHPPEIEQGGPGGPYPCVSNSRDMGRGNVLEGKALFQVAHVAHVAHAVLMIPRRTNAER